MSKTRRWIKAYKGPFSEKEVTGLVEDLKKKGIEARPRMRPFGKWAVIQFDLYIRQDIGEDISTVSAVSA